MESSTECVVLVLLEMGLSFSGIVCNLLVVATLRHEETLRGTTLNYLLLNLCFSNLLISFLVKPISAIYVGYAVSTGEWHIGLTFCTLYTFIYRTTWCIFPFTLVAISWCKLAMQCRCGLCNLLCCILKKKHKTWARGKRRKKEKEEEVGVALVVDKPDMSTTGAFDRHHLSAAGAAGAAASHSSRYATFTELALQYGSGTIRHGGSLLFQSYNARDSISSPSTAPATDNCGQQQQQQQQQASNNGESSGNDLEADSDKTPPKRTIEDGPTARQKVLISSIWLLSAFFGVTTCFPDKVFGVAMSQKILEDQLRTIPPSPSANTRRDVDLTYCTVKTGVNDLLDYLSIVVSLALPLLLGPGLLLVFQGFFIAFGHFVCGPSKEFHSHLKRAATMVAGPLGPAAAAATDRDRRHHATASVSDKEEGRPHPPRRSPSPPPSASGLSKLRLRQLLHRPDLRKGPGWGVVVGFTVAFLATYPVHLYVAEVHLPATEDDGGGFAFLLVKYCLGFLFLVLVPVVVLATEPGIRAGVRTVFGSDVLCSLREDADTGGVGGGKEEEGEDMDRAAAGDQGMEDKGTGDSRVI